MACQIPSVREQEPLIIKRIGSFDPQFNCPTLFFDGAAQDGLCVAGGAIFLNEFHYFALRLNCGAGTNMKAELLALWCVLKVASVFGIDDLKIFEDSRVTIKWAQDEYNVKVLSLIHWSNKIKSTIHLFRNISLEHIYKQHNLLADKLSKQAVSSEEGVLIWEEIHNSQVVDLRSLKFFE